MQVTLQIDLVPTGAVVAVNVVSSSGNDAFDRSAVAAVYQTERFDELKQLESRVFERYYRRFSLLFNPGDLRL
jgi:colicin import membrane protein